MVKVATKTCSKCHACKPATLFQKKRNQCNACYLAKKREYRQQNKEKIAAKKRKYRQQNKEKIAAKSREYRQREDIKAKKREYRQQNKEKIAAKSREYRQQNKEKIAARMRKYRRREDIKARMRKYRRREDIKARMRKYRRREDIKAKYRKYYRQRRLDPEFNLIDRLRRRMNHAVKAAGLDKKCDSSSELLGISPQGLKEWLESQFTDGMTWENRSDWHIDHRVPCAAFDLSDEKNQRICFWYKNLQPMWAKDNMQKSNTYTEEEKNALMLEYSEYYKKERI